MMSERRVRGARQLTGTGLIVLTALLTGAANAQAATPGASPQASAGEACVINAPSTQMNLIGHVAWGWRLPGGNWEFGANEGPGKNNVSETWHATAVSQRAMLAALRKGGPYQAAGFYVSVECVTVPAPKAAAAQQQVLREQGGQYQLVLRDCESQAYNVLSAYGVSGLPDDISDPVPNNWYQDLGPSAGFSPPKPL
jgi:hypothetical protein